MKSTASNKLYKCSYCDSVFEEFHTNCPNCGGSSWLTSNSNKQIVETKTSEIVEDVICEDSASEITSNQLGDVFTVVFTIFMLGLVCYIILTSNPVVWLLNDLFGI